MRRHHRAYPIYIPGKPMAPRHARCPGWVAAALVLIWTGIVLGGVAQVVRHAPLSRVGPMMPRLSDEAWAAPQVGPEQEAREWRIRNLMATIRQSWAERARLAERDGELIEALKRARQEAERLEPETR